MAGITVSQVTPNINENSLKFIENNGQILFSSKEIGRQPGYKKLFKSINILCSKKHKELQGYATGIKLMQVDGCLREVRCVTEEAASQALSELNEKACFTGRMTWKKCCGI